MESFRMKKRLEDYRLVIFDLDGTLYYQRPLRAAMAGKLCFHYLRHPGTVRELLVLMQYRRLREKMTDLKNCSDARQYGEAGLCGGLSAKQAEAVIRLWMYEVPCRILKRFRDEELCAIVRCLMEKGVKTAVYSDYPVSAKLHALGMDFPYRFSAGDADIRFLKPAPDGIVFILQHLSVEKEDAILIGDRLEKDGEAAAGAGIDYFILSPAKSKRARQIQMLSGAQPT